MRCRCHGVEVTGGNYKDVLIYPEYREQTRRGRRKKWCPSTEDQEQRNQWHAEMHFKGLVHANFTEEDETRTYTFADEHNPETKEQAKRAWVNYVRKDKAYRARNGLPQLEYLYCIEQSEIKCRWHVHAIMRGGMLSNDVHRLWGNGIVNISPLCVDLQNGLAALSVYLSKPGKNKRRWTPSKGLKQPERVDRPNFITQKKALEIASSPDDRQAIEALFPGWRVAGDGCKVYHSRYDDRPIIHASLYRDTRRTRARPSAQGKSESPPAAAAYTLRR